MDILGNQNESPNPLPDSFQSKDTAIALHDPNINVVVLGGGMAGIAAAARLAEAGLRPTLLESRPYLGGRTRSFIHAASGDEIDNGQHLMMGCYRSTFRLLDMLGTRALVELQRTLRVEFRDPDGSRDLLDVPSILPAPLNVLFGMLSLRKLSFSERLRLLRIGLAVRFSTPRDKETVREYLERHGQSRRAQERLWHPIVIATLNTPPDTASAFLFAQVMKLAFLGGAEDSSLAFSRCGLSRLIEPAREFIEHHGGNIATGTPVTGLERAGNGYRIHLKDRSPITADAVVSALQQPMLRSLWKSEDITSIPWLARPIPFSPIVSIYLWFDRELTGIPPFGAMIGTNVQWMFDRRAIAPAEKPRFPGLLSCTISAAFAESMERSEGIVETAVSELRGAFPELDDAELVDALVVKEKQATFTASPEVELQRPHPSDERLPGFFAAGDWTNTGLPGTIEGAVRSGFDAAELLIRSYGDRSNG